MRRLRGLCAWIAFCSLLGTARANDAVLIEFASSRCVPCQQMQPVLQQLSQSGVAIRAVDVNQEPDLTRRYGVRETPTFIVMSGGKELTRLVGKQSIQDLQNALSVPTTGPWVDTSTKPADPLPMTRLAPLPTSLVPPHRNASGLSEAMPSVTVADAVQRAQAATVRLRVYDGNGFGAGTGTIIDVHGEEALVLTCGHLFRDTKGQGRIEVDIFLGGEAKTVPAQLIDYDADERDIALVAIRPGYPVQPVKIIGPNELPRTGDVAFSFGCDRGADPSRRDTRISGVNKYNQDKGASNLEIEGAPIDGRSGGGLFDTQGRLIGVCNAADYDGDVGIYTGPGSIHWQLDRIQLSKLYMPSGSAESSPATAVATALETGGAIQQSPYAELEQAAASTGAVMASPAPAMASDAEVIVIVRDKGNPSSSPRVVTLAQPSPEFLQMLDTYSR